MEITSSSFGSITVDNVKYEHDVYILPSGEVEEREHSHTFTKEQIEHVLALKPDVIFIGTGTSGVAKLNEEAKKLLEESGIEYIVKMTPDLKEEFNSLAENKKVAAVIHTTC